MYTYPHPDLLTDENAATLTEVEALSLAVEHAVDAAEAAQLAIEPAQRQDREANRAAVAAGKAPKILDAHETAANRDVELALVALQIAKDARGEIEKPLRRAIDDDSSNIAERAEKRAANAGAAYAASLAETRKLRADYLDTLSDLSTAILRDDELSHRRENRPGGWTVPARAIVWTPRLADSLGDLGVRATNAFDLLTKYDCARHVRPKVRVADDSVKRGFDAAVDAAADTSGTRREVFVR